MTIKMIVYYICHNFWRIQFVEIGLKLEELHRCSITRLISDLNEIGFKPTKDMEEKFNERVKEVEALTQEIGIPDKPEKAKKKEKKNEVAIQPVE